MKIYSDTIAEAQQVRDALQAGKERGIIAEHVFLDRLRSFTPRCPFTYGYEVILQAREYDGLGRRNNTGYSGGGEYYAATYDEWGHFIFALYLLDSHALIGPYKGVHHFDQMTGDSYDWKSFAFDVDQFGHDPYPFVTGSVSNGRSGRVGAGRDPGVNPYWQHYYENARQWLLDGHTTRRQGSRVRYAPRTFDEVARFCGATPDEVAEFIRSGKEAALC